MKKKRTKVFNVLGRVEALAKIIRLNISIIVPAFVTIMTGAITIVTAKSEKKDSKIFLIATIVSFVVTILAFVFNLIKEIIKQKQIIIHKYSSKELDIFYDNEVKTEGYYLLKSGLSRLMYLPSENEYVKEKIMHTKYSFKGNIFYSIPADMSRNAYRIFSDYLKSSKYFYDGFKIRMNMGIPELMKISKEEDKVLQLSRTTYFNSICSNEVSKIEMRYDGDISYCFDGYTLVKSKRNINKPSRIYPLSESQCSNHIGVSTLAITSDGYVVISRQGKKNLIESNKYIVSASGSVDLKDRRKCKYFGEILVKAMNRELREECNIKKNDIINTEVIGYGRLLDRGGKPEFFGLTKVNLTANELIELAKKGRETQKEYVSDFLKIKYTKEDIKETVNNIQKNEKVTVQLLYYVEELLK